MPDGRRVTCQNCGARAEDVGPISWRGNCGDCARKLEEEGMDAMHYRTGPVFKRWRRAMAACVGGVLLDDEPPSG